MAQGHHLYSHNPPLLLSIQAEDHGTPPHVLILVVHARVVVRLCVPEAPTGDPRTLILDLPERHLHDELVAGDIELRLDPGADSVCDGLGESFEVLAVLVPVLKLRGVDGE